MTEGSKLDLLLDWLVDDLGNLHLSHLWLGDSDCWVASVREAGVRETGVGEWETGVCEDRGGNLSLLISRPLTSGLSLGQAGNSETEHVGAAGLLDTVSDVLERNLHLLDDGLHDVWGVGEGGTQGIGVAQILS